MGNKVRQTKHAGAKGHRRAVSSEKGPRGPLKERVLGNFRQKESGYEEGEAILQAAEQDCQ
jgi:hypothetical protein